MNGTNRLLGREPGIPTYPAGGPGSILELGVKAPLRRVRIQHIK